MITAAGLGSARNGMPGGLPSGGYEYGKSRRSLLPPSPRPVPPPPAPVTAAAIRARREALNLTRTELAARAGVHRCTVSRLESRPGRSLPFTMTAVAAVLWPADGQCKPGTPRKSRRRPRLKLTTVRAPVGPLPATPQVLADVAELIGVLAEALLETATARRTDLRRAA